MCVQCGGFIYFILGAEIETGDKGGGVMCCNLLSSVSVVVSQSGGGKSSPHELNKYFFLGIPRVG